MATFKMPPRRTEQDSGASNERPGNRDFKPIPATEVLNVEVVKVEKKEKPSTWTLREGEDPEYVNWSFRVLDGPFERRRIWGTTPTWFSWSPKCRLRLWAQSILNMDAFPEDFELDLENLVGKRCRVLVENYTSSKGEVKDRVGDVFPAKTYSDVEEVF